MISSSELWVWVARPSNVHGEHRTADSRTYCQVQFSCCEQGLPTLCKAWAIPPTSLPPSLVALCFVGAETRVACLDRMPKCPRVPWQIKSELEEIYERGPVEAAMKLANNALELRQSPAAPEPSSALPTASEDRCATFHLDFHFSTQQQKIWMPWDCL